MFVTRSPQKTHDRSCKDSQQKQSSIVRQAITPKDSRQKPQGSAAKAIVGCFSGDHRKRLTTEAARIRGKSNRQLFVRRSPQKTHDRSRKDSQQKQSLVVRHAITAKDSRQKPQGFAAKAIVGCLSSDDRKRLTTEAARIRSKSNRWLFVTRSPQKTHDRSRKDSQQKQSLVVCQAITAKDSRQKPQGFAAKAIVNCSSRDHRKRLTTEAARIRSKSNRQLFVTGSPQKTHDRSRKDSQQMQMKWFSSYLSGRTQRCNVSGKLSSARTLSCGVPQGSILGPLLFLIYINDLPNSLRGAVPRMFADDTNLTLSAKTLAELKLALTPELNNLSSWLKANKLSLNVAKTELMIIGSRQRLSAQCDDVEIRIDDQIIKRVVHTKSLGLTIDARLSWGKHVEEICKKVSSAIGALKRVRPFISKETAILIYNTLIMPHFDYCSPVWDCLSGYLSDKLQKLQNRAARVITKSPFDASSNHLLSTLSWERLSLRRKKQKALTMYKTMNDLAPEYLQSLFSQRHSAYSLRNSEGRLTLSKPSTNYLKRSFSYSGAMLWNNLPKNLKNAASVEHFKRNIKKVADISDSHTAIM